MVHSGACLNGHLNATKYFIIEQNCDPNSRGQNGFTPLHCASQAAGHINIIQYLISEVGTMVVTHDFGWISRLSNQPLHCHGSNVEAAVHLRTYNGCYVDLSSTDVEFNQQRITTGTKNV